MTGDGTYSYSYDAEARLVSVVGPNSGAYAYGSSAERLKKTQSGVTTHYVWEGSQVIAEYNGSSGALISEYIYAGGRMVARDQGGVLRYFHQDRLSSRLITDGSGLVAGAMDHLPFGEDAATGAGESDKHRFTSYERDSESGTDYAINRQHQYSLGRFNQPDLLGGAIGNPQSLNRYSYTLNDPVNLVDPLGLDPLVPFQGHCHPRCLLQGQNLNLRPLGYVVANSVVRSMSEVPTTQKEKGGVGPPRKCLNLK
jgi:RHS repeat-associated protein